MNYILKCIYFYIIHCPFHHPIVMYDIFVFPDVSHHSAEGHSRFGGDVRGDGPHIHKLPEQPGSCLLGKLCLPFPQTPGLLGQRSGPQDLLYPGVGREMNTNTQTHIHPPATLLGTPAQLLSYIGCSLHRQSLLPVEHLVQFQQLN